MVEIAERKIKVFQFVATLGYSRRLHVRAFCHERQESWFDGMEISLLAFGGVPEEVLFANPRALVTEHDAETPSVIESLRAVSGTDQGQTARGVGYVKRNAIAGRSFASWEAFEAA